MIGIVGSRRDNPKLPKDFGKLPNQQSSEPVQLYPIIKDLPDPKRVLNFTEGRRKTARRIPGMIYDND